MYQSSGDPIITALEWEYEQKEESKTIVAFLQFGRKTGLERAMPIPSGLFTLYILCYICFKTYPFIYFYRVMVMLYWQNGPFLVTILFHGKLSGNRENN